MAFSSTPRLFHAEDDTPGPLNYTIRPPRTTKRGTSFAGAPRIDMFTHDGPGVGDYDLIHGGRARGTKQGVTFAQGSARPPLLAPGSGSGKLYVGPAPVNVRGAIRISSAPRFRAPPSETPGVGAYSLAGDLKVGAPKHASAAAGLAESGAAPENATVLRGTSTRPHTADPRLRTSVEVGSAAAPSSSSSSSSSSAKLKMTSRPISATIMRATLVDGAPVAASSAAVHAATAAGGRGGTSSTSRPSSAAAVPLPRSAPSIPTPRDQGFLRDPETGQLVAIRLPDSPEGAHAILDLRTRSRPSSAVPFSVAPRFVQEEEQAPPVGTYNLDKQPESTKQGVSFSSGKKGFVESLPRPATANHVGPGSYYNSYYSSIFRPPTHVMPPNRQPMGQGMPRDPLDMDRNARDTKPGPGEYNLAGHDFAKEARIAREADERYIRIGLHRAAEAEEFSRPKESAKLFGGTRSSNFTALNAAVTPRPGTVDLPPPVPKPKLGVAIPAFLTTARRAEIMAGDPNLPGPSDYTVARASPTSRAKALQEAKKGTAFSTSKRFIPSAEEMTMLTNPAPGQYDPFPPNKIVSQSAMLASAFRPIPGHRAGPTLSRRAVEEEEPLPPWYMRQTVARSFVKPTFNTAAARGGGIDMGGGHRASMVSRDAPSSPGPADYSPRKP